METTKFKPGMLVAYGDLRQGVMYRVICLGIVKTVGKRDVKLVGDLSRYKLTGGDWSNPYYRGICPLTKTMYAKAEAAGGVANMGIALGHVLPDEPGTEPVSCCREPKVLGGRCDNCGTWLKDEQPKSFDPNRLAHDAPDGVDDGG